MLAIFLKCHSLDSWSGCYASDVNALYRKPVPTATIVMNSSWNVDVRFADLNKTLLLCLSHFEMKFGLFNVAVDVFTVSQSVKWKTDNAFLARTHFFYKLKHEVTRCINQTEPKWLHIYGKASKMETNCYTLISSNRWTRVTFQNWTNNWRL